MYPSIIAICDQCKTSSCSVHSDATEAEFWEVRQGQARAYRPVVTLR